MKKRKTALSNYIDQLELLASIHAAGGVKEGYVLAASLAKEMLLIEKEQIKLAFDHGQNGEFYQPEKYFNETFQQ